ncbi:PAAR motif-containing protein [Hydromonas duriensis]|uniref:PAAR motif-containing protein n=2 Tax=Hydromonas duriensis TaxID=1527608 RepID=A0A4R6Y4A8_9BURK|nr:PAAR motif-containing protein [Hydromonas duriensis]
MVMRKQIVVGDPPSTGGAVLPYDGPENTLHGHQVALIGGKVKCEACGKIGVIAKAGGPRRFGAGNGNQMALEGDLCICACHPPPPMLSVLHHTSSYDDDAYGNPALAPFYDEQIRAVDEKTGQVLDGVAYYIKSSTGKVYKGYTDEFGLCPRIDTEGAETLTVWFGILALEQEGGI